ncbi:MAG: hypothetical protein Q9172_007105 [Xanthocarpia lactea]
MALTNPRKSLDTAQSYSDNVQPDMEQAQNTPGPQEAPNSVFIRSEKRLIVFIISMAGFFSPLSANIYFPTVNYLARDLDVSLGLINLTITAYLVCQGIVPPIVGDTADMIVGFKRTREMWIWKNKTPPTHIPGPPHLDAPHPNANSSEIESFLIQYSIQLLGLSRDDGIQIASELHFNGGDLYAASEKGLEDNYGFLGRILFYELQHSKYGRALHSIAISGTISDLSDTLTPVRSPFSPSSSQISSMNGVSGSKSPVSLIRKGWDLA